MRNGENSLRQIGDGFHPSTGFDRVQHEDRPVDERGSGDRLTVTPEDVFHPIFQLKLLFLQVGFFELFWL